MTKDYYFEQIISNQKSNLHQLTSQHMQYPNLTNCRNSRNYSKHVNNKQNVIEFERITRMTRTISSEKQISINDF